MLKPLSSLLLFLMLFPSCKQEADDIQPAQPTSQAPSMDPATAFIRAAQSSPAADEYISGEFDGTPLYCSTDAWQGQSSNFYLDNAQKSEYANLIRNNPKADIQLTVGFNNTGLFQRAMPALWPHPNPAYCEQITIELRSLGPNNEELAFFKGGTGFGIPMQVQITSTANGVIEGTFTGMLHKYVKGDYAGAFFPVKNGKFRIKATTVSI